MIGGLVVDHRKERMLDVVGVVSVEEVEPESVVPVVEVRDRTGTGYLRGRICFADLALHELRCLQNISFASGQSQVTNHVAELRVPEILVKPAESGGDSKGPRLCRT